MTARDRPNPFAYLEAARERVDDARTLLEAGRYGGSIWVSGVAVEALFRAYHALESTTLETGHDIRRLWKDSGFARNTPRKHEQDLAEKVGHVAAVWRNRIRYDPQVAVRKHIGARNNKELRSAAVDTVEAAYRIINHGVTRWPR